MMINRFRQLTHLTVTIPLTLAMLLVSPLVGNSQPIQSADFSRYLEKSRSNLTPQPPSLQGKGEKKGENSKPLSLQERGLERGFPNPVKSKIQSERPEPPDTGTPSGNPTPGTTRPEATCPDTNKPLTALLANNGNDFTVSEYPTFWFYVPYTPNQISIIEFLLLDEQGYPTIYQTSVKLTDRPGLIKITIPSEPHYALKLHKNYRWQLNFDCEPDRTIEPDLMLNGWIRRIPITSQLENQLEGVKPKAYIAYQDNNIWYDAITSLAELYSANPENREFAQDWANLLELLGLNWVTQEPFVDAELLPLDN